MVSQVSNAVFVQDALKYVQGMPTTQSKTPLLDDLKMTAVMGSVFTAGSAANIALKAKKYGIKGAFGKASEDFAKEVAAAKALKGPNKVVEFVKNLPGIKQLRDLGAKKATAEVVEEGVKTAAKGAKGGLGKLLKANGAGFMIGLDMLISTFTEIVPAFQNLGMEEGFKQIGKSAVQTVAYTGGYVAASSVGAAIGTAICPGLGTAIGALAGMLGGALFSGVAKKFTGKNASEKIAEKQEEQQAQEIAKDTAALEELKALVSEKVAQEQAAGTANEETVKMAQELKALTPATTTQTPSFTGLSTQQAPQTTSNPFMAETAKTTTSNIFASNPAAFTGDIKVDPSIYAVPQDKLPKTDFTKFVA